MIFSRELRMMKYSAEQNLFQKTLAILRSEGLEVPEEFEQMRPSFIVLNKIDVTDLGRLVTPGWKDYKPGRFYSTHSLPISYILEGFLLYEITVGQPLCVLRITRNEVLQIGQFVTSPVIELHGREFITTRNSVYHYRLFGVSPDFGGLAGESS